MARGKGSLEPSRPRILLEVLSPSGTRLVFFILYGAFAFAIWLGRVTRLHESGKRYSPARASAPVNDTVSWTGKLIDLGELFGSVALEARFPNGTNATSLDETLGYALRVKASQKPNPAWRSGTWQEVLSEKKATASVKTSDPTFGLSTALRLDNPDDKETSSHYIVSRAARLSSWYQNMEAAPSRSRVHSYAVVADFCCPVRQFEEEEQDPDCPFVSPGLREALEAGGELRVAYDDVSRLETPGLKLARFGLVAAWLAIAVAWLPQATMKRREARKNRAGGTWTSQDIVADENDKENFARLILLVISLLLFIDALDCCIQFAPHKADIPPLWAFLSFASRRFGEAGLLGALLLAADGEGAAANRIRLCYDRDNAKKQLRRSASSAASSASSFTTTVVPPSEVQKSEVQKYEPPTGNNHPLEVDDDLVTNDEDLDEEERRHRLAISVVRAATEWQSRRRRNTRGAPPPPPPPSAQQQLENNEDVLDYDSELEDLLRHEEQDDDDDSVVNSMQRRRFRRRHLRHCGRICQRHWWLLFPLMYVVCSVAALGLRFPSLWGLHRAPTLALASWPTSALMQFVAYSLAVMVSVVGWAICFVWLLWRAATRLEKAPYLLTRRHQLAYRFFVLQASLVAGVAIASYAALVVKLVSRYREEIATATSAGNSTNSRRHALRDLASALEALVADDVRDLASAFFFCIYVGLLCYLNLPPPAETMGGGAAAARYALDNYYQEDNAALTYLRRFVPQAAAAAVDRARGEVAAAADLGHALVGARFVMTEHADAKRRRAWRRAVRDRAQRSNGRVPAHLSTPPDFFVVDTARWLVRVAAEAYFDIKPPAAPPEEKVEKVDDDKEAPLCIEEEEESADDKNSPVKETLAEEKIDSCREEGEEEADQKKEADEPRLTGGSAGIGDAARIGLEAIAEIHNEEDDTYSVVFKHLTKPWLVIAFRGSASLKHWYTNIRISQHRLSLCDDKPKVYAEKETPSSGHCRVASHNNFFGGNENKTDEEVGRTHNFADDDDEDDEDTIRREVKNSDPESPEGRLSSEQEDEDQEEEQGTKSRIVVDSIMRCFALAVHTVERTFVLVTETAEAASRVTGAANIPGVDRLVLPCVHKGFWYAYSGIRDELHRVVLKACCEDPRRITRILVTGHSLGGAMATLAAADLAAHALPHMATHYAPRRPPRLTLMSFGAPRVGNHVYARLHDALVPDSFRVISDGDLVTAVPRLFFKHAGTPCVVDGRKNSTGYLIVDPSFIEQRLKLRVQSQITSHYVEAYVRGLYGAAGLDDPTNAELAKFAKDQQADGDHHNNNAPAETSRIRALCQALRCCREYDPNSARDAQSDLAAPLLPPSSSS